MLILLDDGSDTAQEHQGYNNNNMTICGVSPNVSESTELLALRTLRGSPVFPPFYYRPNSRAKPDIMTSQTPVSVCPCHHPTPDNLKTEKQKENKTLVPDAGY